MTRLPSNAVIWFAVLGGGVAWVVQFTAGLAFTWAGCQPDAARTMVAVRGWQSVLAIGGTVVGLLAVAVALRLYRQTARVDDVPASLRRGDGPAPPVGRVHFLATVGLLINALALAMMVMTAIGAPLLRVCQQS